MWGGKIGFCPVSRGVKFGGGVAVVEYCSVKPDFRPKSIGFRVAALRKKMGAARQGHRYFEPVSGFAEPIRIVPVISGAFEAFFIYLVSCRGESCQQCCLRAAKLLGRFSCTRLNALPAGYLPS